MILIGSHAVKHYYPDFPREPKDYDYIVKEKPKNLTLNTEYLKNSVLEDYPLDILDPDTLCTLKASHLMWDINWDKHMFDVQFLLKKGHKIDSDLFYKLYKYWNTIHVPNSRSKLSMSKEDFFDNAINYDKHQHDFVHTLINPIPVYTKVLKDSCEVELDENKFISLSFEDKLNFVREEVMVMAWERFKDKLDFRRAYTRMLKKFIIDHAPLWSLQFIITNYIVLHITRTDYYQIIENGLN